MIYKILVNKAELDKICSCAEITIKSTKKISIDDIVLFVCPQSFDLLTNVANVGEVKYNGTKDVSLCNLRILDNLFLTSPNID